MKKKTNPKRQQIIATARALFWKYGIKRITIEEICKEAHVSKMTFYKHFNNKIDLLKKLFDEMIGESMVDYNKIMVQEIPFKEKVKQTIQLKMDSTNDLSQKFFADIHKNATPELRDYLTQSSQQRIHKILSDYIEAQKTGDVRKEIKPQFILYFLNHLYEIVKDDRLVQLYDSPQDLIMELTNFFFYGILQREK